MNVLKQIVATIAVFASALFAYGANITGITPVNAELDNDTYQATPDYSDNLSNYNLGSGSGWVAGIKLTWDSEVQVATSTSASVDDNLSGSLVNSFTVGYARNAYTSSCTDESPSGSGLANTFYSKSSGKYVKTYTHYMVTTDWYFCVTPEKMYACYCDDKDYSATLTIGGNTYTITVPRDIILSDGSHQWYPAVGLLGNKVYGDAQYLADQITLDNYTTVKFLSDPSGLDFPEGKFKAGAQGEDGKWSVELNHQHSWSFPVSADGATLTATCGSEGCPYETTTVSLTLSGSDKVYDNKAITASADFDSSFKTIFPDAEATISTTKDGEPIDNDKIKDAGEYVVTMTVTGLSGGQSRDVSRNVTISKVVITDAMLSFTPANQTYTGAEQTVTPSVNANGLAATIVVDTENSITSATEMGTYSVTVKGTGNFTGSATATWSIVNTTGAPTSVAPSAAGSMTNVGNDFTLSDSLKLEYDAENEVWYAGITITWPMVEKKTWGVVTDVDYVTEEMVKVTKEYGEVNNVTEDYTYLVVNTITYVKTTTWKVGITPAIVEAALDEGKTALEWTARAGAISSDTYNDGVAFQDYTITIPLDDNLKLYDNYENQAYPELPYVAQIDGKKYLSLEDALTASESGQMVALIAQDDYVGEYEIPGGRTVALGAFGSSDATYVLSIGSVLTSDAKCTVSTSETGYGVELSGECPYSYNVVLRHVHDWQVVAEGSVLTATCVADACPLDPTTYSMSLFTGANKDAVEDIASKTYDGASMSRKAVYGDGFTDVFQDVETQISVTKGGESVDTINDVGEYVVTMTVTGLGDEPSYELSKTVTISPVDISEAKLELSPKTTPYNGTEQKVTPSVNANGLAATIVVDTENSITSATEMGKYSVTVKGTGNFTGSATATWSIVNTTGAPTSVAASAAGSMTNVDNDFTLSDSSKLEYDAGNEVWYAGITIAWPMSKTDYEWHVIHTQQGSAKYVKEESAKITTVDGFTTNVMETASYKTGLIASKDFTYLSTTTWKVALTPAIIDAARAEAKISLTYTMNAGAFIWGDDTEGDPDGVAFTDYTITIPLGDITLYDGDGKQVYPKPEGQTIIEDIKDDIGDVVSDAEVAESAKGKIDDLVSSVVESESPEQDVANWVVEVKKGYDTPADFYTALAQSDYVEASFELGTEKLITEDSEVEVADFEPSEDGFTFEVKIDYGNIEAVRVQAASIIQTATSLGGDGGFGSLAADRIKIVGNKIIIEKDPDVDREFFKIVIDKDSAK